MNSELVNILFQMEECTVLISNLRKINRYTHTNNSSSWSSIIFKNVSLRDFKIYERSFHALLYGSSFLG